MGRLIELKLNRRDVLGATGGLVAGGLVGLSIGQLESAEVDQGQTPDAAGRETRVHVIPEGTARQITVGDGETLENVLIDISAPGADARIEATGDDWTVRNVGFRGQCDVDKSTGFWNRLHLSGNGVVERVYLGDGAVSRIDAGGAGCPSGHSGHVTIRDSYFAGWTDNALYTAHAAEDGNGTFHVQDCYFRDNNVAHLRIAADGDLAERVVIENTGKVPQLDGGDVFSRGVYTGYGDPSDVVEIRDCDIDVTTANTNGAAQALQSPENHPRSGACSTLLATDCEINGGVVGIVTTTDTGSAPDTSVPPSVPKTALHAALPWIDDGGSVGYRSASGTGPTSV